MFNRDNFVCNFEYTWLTFLFPLRTILSLTGISIFEYFVFQVETRTLYCVLITTKLSPFQNLTIGILPFVKKIVPVILLENFYSLYLRFSSSSF